MIKGIYNFISRLNPLQREMLRLFICLLTTIALNILLYVGVELDGDINAWASVPISVLTSTKLISFIIYYFLPFFIYTLAKAWWLDVLRQFKGVLNFMANQITGVLYCSGLVSITLGVQMVRLSEPFYQVLYFYGSVLFFCGFVYFYIFQCVIQKSMTPELWHNKSS